MRDGGRGDAGAVLGQRGSCFWAIERTHAPFQFPESVDSLSTPCAGRQFLGRALSFLFRRPVIVGGKRCGIVVVPEFAAKALRLLEVEQRSEFAALFLFVARPDAALIGFEFVGESAKVGPALNAVRKSGNVDAEPLANGVETLRRHFLAMVAAREKADEVGHLTSDISLIAGREGLGEMRLEDNHRVAFAVALVVGCRDFGLECGDPFAFGRVRRNLAQVTRLDPCKFDVFAHFASLFC